MPASPVSPASLPEHLAQPFPWSISMVKVADSIESRDCTAVRDKNTGLDKTKCLRWRAQVRTCWERHPGLCIRHEHNLEVARMFRQFCGRFQKKSEEAGLLMLRWRLVTLLSGSTSRGTGELGDATYYTRWVWQLGNPRRHGLIDPEKLEEPESEDTVVSIITEADEVRIEGLCVHYAHDVCFPKCSCRVGSRHRRSLV